MRLASRGFAVAVMVSVLATACSRTAAVPPAPPVRAEAPEPTITSAPPPSPTTAPSPSPSLPHRFEGTMRRLPDDVRAEMHGTTWHRGCPVALGDLRFLTFRYWGFDGEVHEGPMVVNVGVAADVLGVFHQLFDARFPIKHVALANEYKPKHDDPSQHRSVTASFNCRPVITTEGPQQTLSQHSYGLAVDVNPLQNPEVALDGYVRDKAARAYRDRSQQLPGMIHAADVVVRAFAAIGWKWGGDWSSMKDYMHFSSTGR